MIFGGGVFELVTPEGFRAFIVTNEQVMCFFEGDAEYLNVTT